MTPPRANAQGFRVTISEVPDRVDSSDRGSNGSIASDTPRPGGLAIGDRVRLRRPNLGRPPLGADVARPMFSFMEIWRSRSELQSGQSRPLASHSGLCPRPQGGSP